MNKINIIQIMIITEVFGSLFNTAQAGEAKIDVTCVVPYQCQDFQMSYTSVSGNFSYVVNYPPYDASIVIETVTNNDGSDSAEANNVVLVNKNGNSCTIDSISVSGSPSGGPYIITASGITANSDMTCMLNRGNVQANIEIGFDPSSSKPKP